MHGHTLTTASTAARGPREIQTWLLHANELLKDAGYCMQMIELLKDGSGPGYCMQMIELLKDGSGPGYCMQMIELLKDGSGPGYCMQMSCSKMVVDLVIACK